MMSNDPALPQQPHPSNWRSVKAAQLASAADYSCVGGPFGSDLTTNDYVSHGVPVIRGTNLNGRTRWMIEDGFVFVGEDKAEQLRRNWAYPGDLVFTQRGTLGGVALIRQDSRFNRFVLSQSQMKLTPNTNEVHPEFLYYYFASPMALRIIERATIATGLPHINLGILKSFPVPLPPLPEQRKIAAILSSIDDAIEATQAVIDQLHVVKKALMAELLTRGLPGRHTRFKQTEIGEVPEGWEVLPGEKLFSLFGGYGPSDMAFDEHGTALFLKVDDFNRPANRGGLREAALRYEPAQNRRIKTYAPGHIVFPKRGAAIFKNRVQVLHASATVDPNLMVLAPGERIDAEFFAYLMLFIGLHNLGDNSGIPQINNKHLYPCLFAIPTISEQLRIRSALSAIDEQVHAELLILESVDKLKSALSSALLTGEIRVQPDEASP